MLWRYVARTAGSILGDPPPFGLIIRANKLSNLHPCQSVNLMNCLGNLVRNAGNLMKHPEGRGEISLRLKVSDPGGDFNTFLHRYLALPNLY